MQIIVKLTTACNLNCTYCSEGDKPAATLPLELVRKLVDDLPELLEATGSETVELLWHGGEPLTVGRAYLEEAMGYAAKKLAKYRLRFLIQTNGSLIDDEWIALFKKFDVGVGVSLDGYKAIHDANRLDKDGQPTWDKIIANIGKLQAAGLRPGTLMVLNTTEEIDVDELLSCLDEYDLAPKIHPVIPSGRAAGTDSGAIYERYIALLKTLYTRCAEDPREIVIEPLEDIMTAILTGGKLRECSFNGSCGREFMCLHADGSVGFCGRVDSRDAEFLYGNLAKQSLLSLYESANAEKIRQRRQYLEANDCAGCADWSLCQGGCSFEAVNAAGELYGKYPHCESRRELLRFLRGDGLQLLKERLLKEKQTLRLRIREEEKMLERIKNDGRAAE